MEQQAGGLRFVRITEVLRRTGLSRSTINRLERAGKFPRRRQISDNAVGWIDYEFDRWLENRVNGGHREGE